MAAMLVFQTKESVKIILNWNTNMAAVTSCANALNSDYDATAIESSAERVIWMRSRRSKLVVYVFSGECL
jgi:hypothetical protein